MSINEDQFWTAVQNRDRSFDGKFFFGVLTTGVYCRPSCACRLPLRKNVRFFLEPGEAERAGLRACERCRPLATRGADPDAARVETACAFIREHAQESIRLADIAAHVGLSAFHFQRSFKAILGVTPAQYHEGCRLEALKSGLRTMGKVTDAIYEAGYGSGSRVYEKVDTRLGMTPSQYRGGGRGVSISYASTECALGRMMIGATDRGICFLHFGDSDDELVAMLRREYPQAQLGPMQKPYQPQFREWMASLDQHLRGQSPRLDLPLDLRATAFQLKVWRYLQSIPYGSVQSYGEVAAGLGQPTATRAVARACATNRVALVIPCHRVIRGTGEMGGYRWGVDRKRTLIDTERASAAAQS
ncbi:MAG: bifunctional DNA-binding transcriptional regulator/O6-methylguanine-DNA methyltransferase Ada [Acidobacteria bacterium]|nr:bifunctional DNA-binding transcriptional regulator/O6-methylguanine-DNA methyltransferase Ada [Acidobacteriota bacterium]